MYSHVVVQKNRIENTYSKRYGGYITYFKLLIQGCKMLNGASDATGIKLTAIQKTTTFLLFFIQFIFKPLLWVFSTKTRMVGEYTTRNSHIFNGELKVKRIWNVYILRFPIPLHQTRRMATIEDLKKHEII